MAADSLAHYDGSAGFIVDSNVWIDCMDAESPWNDWAINQMQICGERAPLHVNVVIYTELLVPEPDVTALDAMLDVYGTQRSSLPWNCAALAAKAFGLYRRRGGARRSPLPRRDQAVFSGGFGMAAGRRVCQVGGRVRDDLRGCQ